MVSTRLTPENFFKTAQAPSMWLSSAERLQAAAEIILSDQAKLEDPYSKAVEEATGEAIEKAIASPNLSATVEIAYPEPNFLPALLLYAFAMENALKGLIIAKNPTYVAPDKLHGEINSHDLKKLADKVGFLLSSEEVEVLKLLSDIGTWMGRYPVATNRERHTSQKYPQPSLARDRFIEWSSQHPVMRTCFARMVSELTESLPRPPGRFGVVVAAP